MSLLDVETTMLEHLLGVSALLGHVVQFSHDLAEHKLSLDTLTTASLVSGCYFSIHNAKFNKRGTNVTCVSQQNS